VRCIQVEFIDSGVSNASATPETFILVHGFLSKAEDFNAMKVRYDAQCLCSDD